MCWLAVQVCARRLLMRETPPPNVRRYNAVKNWLSEKTGQQKLGPLYHMLAAAMAGVCVCPCVCVCVCLWVGG